LLDGDTSLTQLSDFAAAQIFFRPGIDQIAAPIPDATQQHVSTIETLAGFLLSSQVTFTVSRRGLRTSMRVVCGVGTVVASPLGQ
jgi:hypothetical protein